MSGVSGPPVDKSNVVQPELPAIPSAQGAMPKRLTLLKRNKGYVASEANASYALQPEIHRIGTDGQASTTVEKSYADSDPPVIHSTPMVVSQEDGMDAAYASGGKSLSERTKEYFEVRARIFNQTVPGDNSGAPPGTYTSSSDVQGLENAPPPYYPYVSSPHIFYSSSPHGNTQPMAYVPPYSYPVPPVDAKGHKFANYRPTHHTPVYPPSSGGFTANTQQQQPYADYLNSGYPAINYANDNVAFYGLRPRPWQYDTTGGEFLYVPPPYPPAMPAYPTARLDLRSGGPMPYIPEQFFPYTHWYPSFYGYPQPPPYQSMDGHFIHRNTLGSTCSNAYSASESSAVNANPNTNSIVSSTPSIENTDIYENTSMGSVTAIMRSEPPMEQTGAAAIEANALPYAAGGGTYSTNATFLYHNEQDTPASESSKLCKWSLSNNKNTNFKPSHTDGLGSMHHHGPQNLFKVREKCLLNVDEAEHIRWNSIITHQRMICQKQGYPCCNEHGKLITLKQKYNGSKRHFKYQ